MTSSLEASPGGLSRSPSSSGRTSPVSTKWSQFAHDEPPTKDKAFRRYASGVERSLSLFDTALQEWADYISFLGRLLKSLQARPPLITAVPSKSIVAKRLAQCLNPSLPSGVHQKALEVYSYIFSMIGKDSLSRDLPLYLPGISSTLSFASLSVRGPFLEIFEVHILQLERKALRPAAKAVILALLPGLEEETSDEFDRTLRLIDSFKLAIRPPWSEDLEHGHATGDEYFWQCFFLASVTGTNRRLGALAYLTRNLPKLAGPSSSDPSSQLANIVTAPEPGLLVRCFAAGLLDEHILIQRGFQDLLISHLPLHSDVLQKHVNSEDLELLLTAAASIVTRREMSLNRRLWSWLLGPEPTTDAVEGNPTSPTSPENHPNSLQHFSATRYFEDFGLRPLTRALLHVIASETPNAIERARPFRICLSLMDRWEIGGLVVPDIFLPIVRSVRKYKLSGASRHDFADVLKSASVFFDGVESGLIWGEIMTLLSQTVHEAGLSIQQRLDSLSLVSFMVTHFNVNEEEMVLVHIPLNVLGSLASLSVSHQEDDKSSTVQQAVLEVVVALLETVPERAFRARGQDGDQLNDGAMEHTVQARFSNVEIVQRIKKFYTHDQGNLEISPPPLSPQDIAALILREAIQQAKDAMLTHSPSAELAIKIKMLVLVVSKVPLVRKEQVAEILSAIMSRIADTGNQSFIALSSTVLLIITLSTRDLIMPEQLADLVEPLVRLIWLYLAAAKPKHHVEAVRLLWQIQYIVPSEDRGVEAALSTIIIESRRSGTFASQNQTPGHAFAILWTHTMLGSSLHSEKQSLKSPVPHALQVDGKFKQHSPEVMLQRPLFLLLDTLSDESTQLCAAVKAWLQSLSFIDRLSDMFIGRFLAINFVGMDVIAGEEIGEFSHFEYDEVDDCLYYIRVLSNVLRYASSLMWETFAEANIAKCANGAAVLEVANHHHLTFLALIVRVCLRAIWGRYAGSNLDVRDRVEHLHRAALGLLHQILTSPPARTLADLALEENLIKRLHRSLDERNVQAQSTLLEVVLDTLKMRVTTLPTNSITSPSSPLGSKRPSIIDSMAQSRLSQQVDGGGLLPRPTVLTLPITLLQCLQAGLASATNREVLDNWIDFLVSCLPLYADSIFQVLIPLIETLCSQSNQVFTALYKTFQTPSDEGDTIPESSLLSLLAGLEHVLARAHDQLLKDEVKAPPVKNAEPQQGFFGNMVSGVFATETAHTRSATANDRLTVLLCFQDAIKICFQIWSWGTRETSKMDDEIMASFHYTNLRMRNRARRLLEHLFAAETLECLETIIELWQTALESQTDASRMLDLLHVLDGARPRYTIPAIFDAIYSRSNPGALEPTRRSTLTSTLNEATLVTFLVGYTKSLDDDAMDEIWSDCMTFLRDILTNPFPHRQTLPQLLEFAAILGEKVDNTNFGEQKKMRRELGDLFIRLLTAIFTTKPISFTDSATETEARLKTSVRDVVDILASTAPKLPKVLVEQDRILLAANTISTNVIGPTFRSKQYPENVSKSTLILLYQLSRLPNTQKLWKKDLGDAFNDVRFFSNNVSLVEDDWLRLIKQWLISDKEKLPELLTRLVPPTTAGIVFGVGATSARLEADRKAQLNLRRIATIVLAMDDDSCASDLPAILEKIVELLAATSTSSPSSTTRADIYLLIRALVLKTSPIHLAGLWPVVNTELQAAVSSVIAPDNSMHADTYNNFSTLQACKLLDCLICIAPDEFQLHEWLFVTDTIDAVYRPPNSEPTSLVDDVSLELGSMALKSTHFEGNNVNHSAQNQQRRLLIRPGSIEDEGVYGRKDELMGKVLRPFFGQLSIFAFESVYSMGKPDVGECKSLLLHDIFDERSIVKAL